jgi:hypothetical protein
MSHQETYRGIVHGSSVELSPALNLPDGMEVDDVIKRVSLTSEQKRQRLEALFGSCQSDADDLDRFLEWNRKHRKRNRNGHES